MTAERRLRRAEAIVARLRAGGQDVGPERLAKLERLRLIATRHAWDDESAKLINWFVHADLPSEPFDLAYWMRVVDPAKYYASLRAEITGGPGGVRARNGALQEELALLHRQFGHQQPLDKAS